MTLDQGQVIISNGSRSAAIIQALTIRVIRLQPLNPCAFLDLFNQLIWTKVYTPHSSLNKVYFLAWILEAGELANEWDNNPEQESEGNAFDLFCNKNELAS